MQSHRCAAPPTMSRSISVTSAPSRAAYVAALLPAGPPPMITNRVTPARLAAPRTRSFERPMKPLHFDVVDVVRVAYVAAAMVLALAGFVKLRDPAPATGALRAVGV